jgi:hypothetical protein
MAIDETPDEKQPPAIAIPYMTLHVTMSLNTDAELRMMAGLDQVANFFDTNSNANGHVDKEGMARATQWLADKYKVRSQP